MREYVSKLECEHCRQVWDIFREYFGEEGGTCVCPGHGTGIFDKSIVMWDNKPNMKTKHSGGVSIQ